MMIPEHLVYVRRVERDQIVSMIVSSCLLRLDDVEYATVHCQKVSPSRKSWRKHIQDGQTCRDGCDD